MIQAQGKGKYEDLADFVRKQTQASGGVGVVLIVIEAGQSPDNPEAIRVSSHAAVHVSEDYKEHVPEMLHDLAKRVESEQRIERVLAMVREITDSISDTEGNA